jgi:Tol biopolymer transport system component
MWLGRLVMNVRPIVSTTALAVMMAASPFGRPSRDAGLTVTQVTGTAGCGNEYPAFDASGTRFVFESNCDLVPGANSDGSSEIFLMTVDGTRVRQLTSGSGSLGNVGVDASGRTIAFATTRDLIAGQNADGNSEIFIMDVDGGNLRQLTHTIGANEHGTAHYLPALDYAGRRIFFVSLLFVDGNPIDATRIHVVNSDGTGLGSFTSGFEDGSPSIDARGNVYFVGASANLYRARPDGTGIVRLGPDGVMANGNERTGVDAAGSRVAFTSQADLVPGGNPDGSREVFLLDIKTGAITQVTSTAAPGMGCRTPSLAASGQSVVFSCDGDLAGANADRNRELFIAHLQ